MPFKSEAQRRYLFSQEPEVAETFAAHTTEKQMENLPEHVEKDADGGMMCAHCGGRVDADGYAEGGVIDEEGSPGSPMPAANDSNPAEDDENVRDFLAALRAAKK